MLDFLIMIFGGAYFLGRFASERIGDGIRRSREEARQKLYEQNYKGHFAESKDEMLAYEITNHINRSRDELVELVGENLREVLGENYLEKIEKDHKKYYVKPRFPGHTNYDTWAEYLVLAKMGKIPYPLHSNDGFTMIGPPDVAMERMKFCEQIERLLRESGINITLIFEYRTTDYYFDEELLDEMHSATREKKITKDLCWRGKILLDAFEFEDTGIRPW